MDCKVRVKAQEKYGKGADCKEKVKQKKSAGKENFYENEVNSGKAKFCKDGVKQQQEVGKATADGRMEKLRQAARQEAVKASECEKLATEIRQEAPDRQPASAEGTVKW